MQDIHAIKPPVQAGFDPMILKIVLMVAAGAVILTLLFFLIKKLWQKKQQKNNPKLLPAPLPPCETALKQLDLFINSSLSSPRLFYFDLTAILRNYIGQSFNITAIEMTSQEFIKNLNALDIDKKVKQKISKFVNLSDCFKYEGTIPSKNQTNKDLLLIREIILQIEKTIKKTTEKASRENNNYVFEDFHIKHESTQQHLNQREKI